MVVPAVPEIVEDEIESAIECRNEALQTIRELGPPDLVHLIKQLKSGGRQSGVYHHVTGVDASSSASLAAYVNTLVYSPTDKTNKVVSGLYCCYNAFSHLDMRVEVKIPGGVESYCIDERGDKRVASDGLWLETFLCAVLRAYSYADDGSGDSIKKIIGVRRFDPITSTEVEHRFLDAAERLFFKGTPKPCKARGLLTLQQDLSSIQNPRSKSRTSSPTTSRQAYSITYILQGDILLGLIFSKSFGRETSKSPHSLLGF